MDEKQESPPNTEPMRWRRIRDWVGRHLAASVISTAVALGGAAIVTGVFSDGPGSAGQQVNELRSAIADEDLEVRDYQPAQLRAGPQSHLFLLSPQAAAGPEQLRIYDVVDQELTEQLKFVPEIGSADPAVITTEADVARLELTDLDSDGQREIVASYETATPDQSYSIPIVIAWDPAQGSYSASPLLTKAPPRPATPPRDLHRVSTAPFLSEFTIADASLGTLPSAWAVRWYAVGPSENPGAETSTLIGATPEVDRSGQVAAMRVSFWAIAIEGGSSYSIPLCFIGSDSVARRYLVEELAPGEDAERRLLVLWTELVRLNRESRAGAVPEKERVYIGVHGAKSCSLGE